MPHLSALSNTDVKNVMPLEKARDGLARSEDKIRPNFKLCHSIKVVFQHDEHRGKFFVSIACQLLEETLGNPDFIVLLL